MEGLGAASSIIGIVSLALQLVQTVQDVNDFLKSLKEAPQEVSRLAENLDYLQEILQDVSNIAEMQSLQINIPVPSSTMNTALNRCKKEIGYLETVLSKAKVGYGSKQKLVRKWNSLKFVVKTKDVKEFEDRIRYSIQLLMLSMTANLSTIS